MAKTTKLNSDSGFRIEPKGQRSYSDYQLQNSPHPPRQEGKLACEPGQQESLGLVCGRVSYPKVDERVIAVAVLVQDTSLLAEGIKRKSSVIGP